MKNIICTIALVAASLLAFTACEDEHYSVLPTFKGFRFAPSAWHPGEKVSVTAVQQSYGDLLYRAKYTWKVECAGKALVDSTITVVYDTDKSDPCLEFQIPQDVLGEGAVTSRSVSGRFQCRIQLFGTVLPSRWATGRTTGTPVCTAIFVPQETASCTVWPAEMPLIPLHPAGEKARGRGYSSL